MSSTETGAAGAPEQPDEKEFELKKAIEHNGQTYSSFTLREPNGDEMRLIRSKPDLDQQIFAISLISGIPAGAVGKFPISVLERGENYLAGFIAPSRRIGGG